jgi:glucokinase
MDMVDYSGDSRIVLTLDAGGTNFRFLAIQGNHPITATLNLPSHGDDLERCLAAIVRGFTETSNNCPHPPVAISFAFPGPADFPNGILGDLFNLPGFRGGVPLGPMLEDRFQVPTFLNNDGDLFVYGEAISGLLPHVNGLLEKAGSHKRYKNLFGVTLGTGFGAGIARDGELFLGDNSMGAEIWLMRNKMDPRRNAEEGASIRAVRRVYAQAAGIPVEEAPEPKSIFEIGMGKQPGNRAAAIEAFHQLAVVVGDAMGNSLTLVDGLAVIGGGISGAWPLFLPALVDELNSPFEAYNGQSYPRLTARAFNLEDPQQLDLFLKGDPRELSVPGSGRKIRHDALPRVGVGMSRLGTSEAVGIGAYAFALRKLDQQ